MNDQTVEKDQAKYKESTLLDCYFVEIERDDIYCYFKCKFCEENSIKILKGKEITSLINHVKCVHAIDYMEVFKSYNEKNSFIENDECLSSTLEDSKKGQNFFSREIDSSLSNLSSASSKRQLEASQSTDAEAPTVYSTKSENVVTKRTSGVLSWGTCYAKTFLFSMHKLCIT